MALEGGRGGDRSFVAVEDESSRISDEGASKSGGQFFPEDMGAKEGGWGFYASYVRASRTRS